MSLRLQRISKGSDTSVPPPLPHPNACNTPPELPISIPLHFHVYTPAAHLRTSFEATSPCRQHASRAPDLLRQTQFDCKAPELHTSTSPRLHACSPSPYLLISTPTACLSSSRSPCLFTSTSARLQPHLQTSFEATPAANLQSPEAPHLYTSSSTHLLPAFRALEAKRQHAYSASPELLRQTPPRPYTCSTPPELLIPIPQHLHVYTAASHLQSS